MLGVLLVSKFAVVNKRRYGHILAKFIILIGNGLTGRRTRGSAVRSRGRWCHGVCVIEEETARTSISRPALYKHPTRSLCYQEVACTGDRTLQTRRRESAAPIPRRHCPRAVQEIPVSFICVSFTRYSRSSFVFYLHYSSTLISEVLCGLGHTGGSVFVTRCSRIASVAVNTVLGDSFLFSVPMNRQTWGVCNFASGRGHTGFISCRAQNRTLASEFCV